MWAALEQKGIKTSALLDAECINALEANSCTNAAHRALTPLKMAPMMAP
jgi:hypothetical protein